MLTQNNRNCPLCDKPANVRISDRWNGHNVNCERCGGFYIEEDAVRGFEQQRYLLSGLTRRSSIPEPTAASRLRITGANIRELLTTSGLPRDLLDQLDATLDYAKKHQQRGDQFFDYKKLAEIDYPLAFARDQEEFL